jgi:hypothetical protein
MAATSTQRPPFVRERIEQWDGMLLSPLVGAALLMGFGQD